MTWTQNEIDTLSKRYDIAPNRRLHVKAEDYHFPAGSFLAGGYTTPGGYVKDFGVIRKDNRLHLFHIDGRPGELCWVTGNEISFGHASTNDYQRWIRHPMPLAVGDRSWESEHVWAPYIYQRGEMYYMFYMGTGHGETFISYATSPDLERWTRRPEGPIRCAVGRDPFVYDDGDETVMLYTGHGGARIGGCTSRDMNTWEPIPDLIHIQDPPGGAAESCSLHPLGDKYVLWINTNQANPLGFRALYAVSDNPRHFDPKNLREFQFRCDTPGAEPSIELRVQKITPLSIELIARGKSAWFVCYFRWHIDRNRLFFGTLDWSTDPATITEINNEQALQNILKQLE